MAKFFRLDSPVMGALSHVGDWVLLSILYVLTSLPVVTLGAATAALYAAIEALHQNKASGCRAFLSAFRKDGLRGTILLGTALVFIGVTGFGAWFYLQKQVKIAAIVLVAAGGIVGCTTVWGFVLQARYENTFGKLWNNGFLCTLSSPIRSLAALAIQLIPAGIFLCDTNLFFYLSIFWISLWPAMCADITGNILSKALVRIVPENQRGTEV